MSEIAQLLDFYTQSAEVHQIAQLILGREAGLRVELTGLTGAQAAFVIAGAFGRTGEICHLIIAADKESAAYMQNDLAGLLEEKTVHFFPDSFKRPVVFDDLNPTQVLQRSEVINKIGIPASNGQLNAEIIVTYPEALFEKAVNPKVLAEHRIEIAKGERLDVDFMISVLVEYGFERADFVYEPGQFSIRGGIIDLFSYGNELPYRIELFDDEVETIRTFDPLTQLSDKTILRISIVPNLNTRFRQDQKVSFFQILPEKAVLWVENLQMTIDRLQYCFDKAQVYADKVSAFDSAELREIFRDRAFLYPGEILTEIENLPIVFLQKQ